jgi:hypothetical protein
LRRFLPHVALVTLGLFWVASMPMAFTGLDAGELGAASAELSVAHPPGFAAFVTTRHALTRLPFADIAARIAAALPARGFLRDAAVISAGVLGGNLLVNGAAALFDGDAPDTGADLDPGDLI